VKAAVLPGQLYQDATGPQQKQVAAAARRPQPFSEAKPIAGRHQL